MGVVTVRPNSNNAGSGWTATGGTLHGVLADDSDASYITSIFSPAKLTLGFPAPSIPAGAMVRLATLLVKAAYTTSGSQFVKGAFRADGGTRDFSQLVSWPSPSSAWVATLLEDLGALDVDNLAVDLQLSYLARVHEISAVILYVAKPVVSMTAPSGTLTTDNRPTVNWSTVLDAHGGDQTKYQVKMFDAATYGGFGSVDPATSAPYAESGILSGNATSWRVGTPLEDDTYRTYLRVGQTINGITHWSDWADLGVVVDVDRPGGPSVSLLGEDDWARISVKLKENFISYVESVLDLDPTLLLPLGNDAGLVDLSGNGWDGTGGGGITVGGEAGPLFQYDEGATLFDGTDDRVTTAWTTRRNLITNPRAGGGATTGWGPGSNGFDTFAAVSSLPTTDGLPLGFPEKGFHFIGSTSGDRQEIAISGLTSGTSYTLSFYWRLSSLSASQLSMQLVTAGTSNGVFTVGGDFARKSFTFTASGTTDTLRFFQNGAGAIEGFIAGILIEVTGSAGEYFDGSGYVEDGEWVSDPGGLVGWTGTANASASDYGCFANGTSRTFMGWVKVDGAATGDRVVWGNGSGETDDIPLRIDAGTGAAETVIGGTVCAFTGTPFTDYLGDWCHPAVIVDEPANQVKLYINGELIETLASVTAQWASGANATQKYFLIGSYTSEFWDGDQAWISVHNRALTADETAEAYELGAGILQVGTDWWEVQTSPDGVNNWEDLLTSEGSGIVINPNPGASGSEVVGDYEPGNSQTRYYRARAVKNHGNDVTVTSDWSTVVSSSWDSRSWWLKHRTLAGLNMAVSVASQPGKNRVSRDGIHQGLGSDRAVVISDKAGPWQGTIVFDLDTEVEREQLQLLAESLAPILIQSPPGGYWTDRWVRLSNHGQVPAVDKFGVETTLDSFDWIEVSRPD